MFVITGGGSGVGRALALALAEKGKTVLIAGRHERTLMNVAQASNLIEYVVTDVSTHEGRQCLIERVQAHPLLEGLIHNAGTIAPIIPLSQINESAWRQMMSTNLDAPLFLTQGLLHRLSEARVLTIGSGAAYFPVVGWSGYCVSKAALSMLTRCWQLECPEIAIASVMPGIVDTDMTHAICESQHMSPEKLDFFKQLKQNHQMLSVDTVALFLRWLLLDLEATEFSSAEWDIYESKHHAKWLPKTHVIPYWEGQ